MREMKAREEAAVQETVDTEEARRATGVFTDVASTGRPRPGWLFADRRDGPSPTDTARVGRRTRSSLRSGKPAT